MPKWILGGFIIFSLTGCDSDSDEPQGISFDGFTTTELTDAEKSAVIAQVETVIGKPYLWGGQSESEGFDCSGLLVWSYNKAKLLGWKWQDRLVEDVTAQTMYEYNSVHVFTITELERGDWIFFDTDKNGVKEHMSIFSHIDDENRVWVWDAYSVASAVSFRSVEDFYGKNPTFAKPMKVEKR